MACQTEDEPRAEKGGLDVIGRLMSEPCGRWTEAETELIEPGLARLLTRLVQKDWTG